MTTSRQRRRRRVAYRRMVLLLFVLTGVVVGFRAFASGPGETGRAGATSSPATGKTSPAPGDSRTPSTPSPTPSASLSPGTPPLPDCHYWDIPARRVGYGDWDRTLLDTAFALPEGYEPPALIPLAGAGFESDLLVRGVLIRDLRALRTAAQAAGNPVEVIAAYRSYTQQAVLFEHRVVEFGEKKALRRAARAGHSEHQLGTAVDFKTAGARSVSVGWGATPAGKWTARNAHRFGFVMSYPRDRASVTCYSYEPWHFRYFGRDVAARIRESGLTVREFLWAQETERSSA